MAQPQPFLHRIFSKDIVPQITETWIYSPEESELYGGFDKHEAVDFAVPTGTPVLAAADGLLLASFNEQRIRHPGNTERSWKGQPLYWGYGLFVMIIHDNGYMTAYAHMHALADDFKKQDAYTEPRFESNGDIVPAILSATRADFGTTYPKIPVKAGQVIGYSGITGMGMGVPTYQNWLDGKPYTVSDEEHVHFVVREFPGSKPLDTFGIYGKLDQYPAYDADWSKLSGSLWLE